MSVTLILLVSAIYWCVAFDQLWKGSYAGFVLWGAYGVANWALALLSK